MKDVVSRHVNVERVEPPIANRGEGVAFVDNKLHRKPLNRMLWDKRPIRGIAHDLMPQPRQTIRKKPSRLLGPAKPTRN